MVACTKTSQLNLLPVFDLLRITISPLHRDVTVGIGVHQYVKGTISFKLGQECDGCGNLPEDGLDFGLDFGLCLLRGRGRCACRRRGGGVSVFLVGWLLGSGCG
jgi:hypothetical protein